MRLEHAWATRGRRSGGGTEPQPGSVGQPGDPLGPKPRRQRLQQVGHPPGRNDGDTLGPHQAPGDAGAVDSDDRADLDVGDAEDLFSEGCPGSWKPSKVSRRARRTSRQRMQISTVNSPSTLAKGPLVVPQNE